ncbi:type I secretion system permease/ATPase [Diaphorobacter sp. HDW4A]|uniref:type I secretion system permease/ATPase n=1 Tax=Diaphorobacter sp. HDW4A TaxID=2714924 RepID=UPI0014074B64|nr:type I secretion system permease/ATPase [Diaphorobacter sp. HDW4A]QIL81705.1 type I secretion system permease/ATPase [Diaphorobacter sp. HDW4A]
MELPKQYTAWLDAMLMVGRHYGIGASAENARVALAWESGTSLDTLLEIMARQMGLSLRLSGFDNSLLDSWRLPIAVELTDGRVGVIRTVNAKNKVGITFSGEQGVESAMDGAELKKLVVRAALLRPLADVPDARVDEYIKPWKPSWFWKIALADWHRYGEVVLASLVANVLALSGMMFSMQVYDRVVPSQSESTLWVLFGGVMLAIAFEFLMRLCRTYIIDILGKRADLQISETVFGRALRLRYDARPKSTGSFIAQIREIDQVRELLTSTTIGAAADIPFFFLFLGVLWLIGGQLVWIPLAALPLLLLPGLLAQRPLARLANAGMRESALRNAMLVEAVQGLDDIKSLRAEPRFQNRWNHVNMVSADIGMRQRFLTNTLMTWTQEIQGVIYAVVLLVGCYFVMKGDMTTGALVGSSILSSRMVSPMAQISSLLARWQQAKVAREGLNKLMERPVDVPDDARRVHVAHVNGNYRTTGVRFQYSEEAKRPALELPNLRVQPGEKIAVLGRMGAGKSTLLQLFAGMYKPSAGSISLDGLDLALIDPQDVRRDVGLLAQNFNLFYGTIRENLVLGRPMATDQELLEALRMSGGLALVQGRPEGLDEMIQEGGLGLSGGQRQALLLARTIVRQPSVLLLDEPTAHFDEVTEHQVIESLTPWLAPRTLIVATHRMQVLQWVDRIIILDNGRVVMDGPKKHVLGELTNGKA